MTPRIPRASAAYAAEPTDAESTRVNGPAVRSRPTSSPPPQRKPAFVAAETVVPIVSYRGPAGSAVPTQPSPARGPHAAPAPHQVLASWQPAAAPTPSQSNLQGVLAELETSVVEQMPRPAPRPHHAPHAQPGYPAHHGAPAAAPALGHRGELTVVFGCRGGAGATTLAVNTAASLARAGRSVCIVDLDLQLGDVFTALDLEPQTSLAAVAREAHALDGVSLRRRLGQHASGVCALTQVGHVDDLDPQLAARFPALLDTLRAHFDHVIVDGVRDFGDLALGALEAATKILVVVTQDVPAVRRASRVLGLVQRLGIPEARCALVINRAVKGAAVDEAAITRALALPVAAAVREDAKVAAALDAGALLLDVARSRPINDDIAKVAALCAARPGEPAAPAKKKFRLFGKAGA